MLRRAAAFGLALLLWACTDRVMLYDVLDAGAPDTGPDLLVGDDAGRDTAAPADGPCRYKKLNVFTPTSPRLVILLDRSSSMQEAFGNSTREDAAKSALLDVVKKYQERVSFGFAQFPADSTDGTYYDCLRGFCCAGPVEIWPGLENYDLMREAILCSSQRPCPTPSDGSPSNAALIQAKEFFSKSKSTFPNNARYTLLVTSSEPSCTVPSDQTSACESAVEAARTLDGMGIGVGVLTVGYQPGPKSCLTQISQSGDVSLPSYAPMSTDDLASALDSLVRKVAIPTCTVDLEYAPPGQPVVSLDMFPIMEDEGDGWTFTNYQRTSITLTGWACDKYLMSSGTLYVGYCAS